MSWLETVKIGNQYMELWPQEGILQAIFPELRVKALMKVYKVFIPPSVAFILFWIYYTCGGLDGLYLLLTRPSAGSMYLYMATTSLMILALILLLLPIHTLFWFGIRAKTPLNAKQKLFYLELMRDLERSPQDNPCMLDLIKAINEGLKRFKDKEFLHKL